MKTCEEIYADMLAVFTEKTGFSMERESDLAVRLYAAAAEIESLYAYADWSRAQSFPQTAEGENLDNHGQLRGLTRQAGCKASGKIRFLLSTVRESDVRISSGTVCTTAGLVRFVTTGDATIAAGALYGDAAAEAEETGAAGNVYAGSICCMTLAPTGVTQCTNPAAFSGGADKEDDDSFRERILDSFHRLPNGANAAFYENRALSFDGICAAKVIPRVDGIGTVGVVVSTMTGAPDDDLIKKIRADLESVREIAVDVTVLAPKTVSVNLAAALWPADGYSFDQAATAAEAALRAYFTGTLLGTSIYLAKLQSLLLATGKVENCVFSAPASDVAITSVQLPQIGTISLTEGT